MGAFSYLDGNIKTKPMKKLLLLNLLLVVILSGCTNNESINDVLIEKSRLTIDECWVELMSPFEFNQNEVDNLVVHEFLKYRVGLIQIESLGVLLKSVKNGNQISIPSTDVMITPPPKTRNEGRRQEYLALYYHPAPVEEKEECSISGIGFRMGSTIAIKFNSDGRFNYSDKLMNIPKSFWGTWKQEGDQIITTNDRSTTGMGIGQQNTYTYDCDNLYLSGFTLVKE